MTDAIHRFLPFAPVSLLAGEGSAVL